VVVIAGLALVLNLSGDHHLDLVGMLWGFGAAVGLAAFFVIADSADGLPPIAMAWGGMIIGAGCLLLLGAVRLLPLHASTGSVVFLQHRTSWVVPVLGLALLAAAVPYSTGIHAARILGAKLASFVGLSEVLFAALFAWLGLGQHLDTMQIVGGGLVLLGIAIVRAEEPQPAPGPPRRRVRASGPSARWRALTGRRSVPVRAVRVLAGLGLVRREPDVGVAEPVELGLGGSHPDGAEAVVVTAVADRMAAGVGVRNRSIDDVRAVRRGDRVVDEGVTPAVVLDQ
jgi:hypothetical protein